jgi:ribulose-phosphate 3-epimerase
MSGNAIFDEIKQACPLVSVGVLTADLMNLDSELALMETAGVRLLHVDVMDGCFCPMMTVGPCFIKAMKAPLYKDVHLMIDEPLSKVESYVAAGADMITVHVESSRYVHRVLQVLGTMTNANDSDRGILRGIALNPGTPLEAIGPLLDEVEMILLLAVNPGWSGQRFISSTGVRVGRVTQMLREAKKDALLCVDGGITSDNIADVARMGADIIVTGSAVFDGKRPLDNARFMIDTVRDAVGTRRSDSV